MQDRAPFFRTPISQAIWEDRYALKGKDGAMLEEEIYDTFQRLAKAIYSKATKKDYWYDKFYSIMAKRQFCPAGRILAQAGTHYSQLLNCFVLPFRSDSLEDIMRTAADVALVQKFGGGTGLDYSILRPEGSYIKGVNGRSCGVIGFLNMMSVVSETIEQGGCLTYDTLINSTDGLIYLGELIKNQMEQGWYDHNVTVKTKDGDKKSPRYFVNGYTDVIRIETDCGVNLQGTPTHKLYVMTDSGPTWKEFKDIQVGDWVIATLGQHSGTLQSLDTDIKVPHHNCVVPERLPVALDTKFAYFLGYFLGNGFTAANEHDRRIGVTIPDKSHLGKSIEDTFKRFFGENIGITVIKKDNDASTTYYVSNRVIKNFFEVNGLTKTNSLTASIPLKIRMSPPDVVASYLSGLFEADGSLRHKYPMLSTSSEALAREVQALLFGLGIPCKMERVYRSDSSFSQNAQYSVSVVSPKGLEMWCRLIPMDAESRFQACRQHQTDNVNQRWYVLPYGDYWLKGALDNLSKFKHSSNIGGLRKELTRLVRRERRLTLSSFDRLRSKVSFQCPEVGNQFFCQVTNRTWKEDYTADLEVDESHTYFANGLISHNSRRGANMGMLRVDHPDVWDFISYKTDHNWDAMLSFMDVNDSNAWAQFKYENLYKWQMYNVSIGVTDEFFEALSNDEEWPLFWEGEEWRLYTVRFDKQKLDGSINSKTFDVMANSEATAVWKVRRKTPYPTANDRYTVISTRRVKTSEMWDKICRNAWADGCPGLLNLSTLRKMHNLEYARPIAATNPCGEQPLPNFGSCLLSSIVLPSFVRNGEIDYEELRTAVVTAVRFMDNVIDNCDFPLEEIREAELSERRIGLGTMGVHDMLIEMKLGYATDEGRKVVEQVLRFIRDTAYEASIKLAEEKGPFPLFDKDQFMRSGFIATLPEEIKAGIREHGIRNCTCLSQAPTGTIGTMYGVSTGCEPWFALSFQRNSRLGSYEDGCQAYLEWKTNNPNVPYEQRPSYFDTAQEISPEDHIKMMVLFTKYVDTAVSKTINLPNASTVADVKWAFLKAMNNGVKGITVFRDGCKEAVLVNKDPKVDEDKETEEEDEDPSAEKTPADLDEVTKQDIQQNYFKKRGNRAVGATTRVHLSGHNMYVTVNRNQNGDIIEVFTTVGESKTPNTRHTSGIEDSWAEGLGKIISLALRAGVNPESIIRNLKNIPSDKPTFATIGDCESSELIPSPPHAIGRVMEEELKYQTNTQIKIEPEITGTCDSCGSTNINPKSPTCYDCKDCGFSRCG